MCIKYEYFEEINQYIGQATMVLSLQHLSAPNTPNTPNTFSLWNIGQETSQSADDSQTCYVRQGFWIQDSSMRSTDLFAIRLLNYMTKQSQQNFFILAISFLCGIFSFLLVVIIKNRYVVSKCPPENIFVAIF